MRRWVAPICVAHFENVHLPGGKRIDVCTILVTFLFGTRVMDECVRG